VKIPTTELFGDALDATATWVGLVRRGVVIRANRAFREVLGAAGTSNLAVLFPCWRDHAGPTTRLACPCPALIEIPDQKSAYCQVIPPRFPERIASQELVDAEGRSHALRLIVIEPRCEPRPSEPAEFVSGTMTRVRRALDQIEHQLINELQAEGTMVRPAGLSRREWDVAQGLAAGKRAPAVAASLGISVHTVRNHLKSVFRKLNVRTQAELRRRLLTPSSR